MFLATTAIEETWDTSQKLVFLGEWCKRYDRRKAWSSLESETLDYHWSDREKLFSDYQYLKGVYERYIVVLAKKLNEVHGTDFSTRYWRIVAGWWLRCFIEILFDRYESLRHAAAAYSLTDTVILADAQTSLFVPADFSTFNHLWTDDPYNFFLYSRIISHRKLVPFRTKEVEFDQSLFQFPAAVNGSTPGLAGRLKHGLVHLARYAPQSLKQVVFDNSYFDPSNLAQLQLNLGQYPSLDRATEPEFVTAQLDPTLRNALGTNTGDDDFTTLLDACIPENMPKSYLEAYALQQNVQAQKKEQPQVIMTSVSHLASDAFKIRAAGKVESGSKLVIAQHGGHRGSGLFNSALDYELEVSDKFFTWGWKPAGTNGEVRIAPASKLVGLHRARRLSGENEGRGAIYLNLSSYPRYALNLYSIPFGATWAKALDFQIDLLAGLDLELRRQLICRPYPKDYGWNERARLQDRFPFLCFEEEHRGWRNCLTDASLVIETNNQTTLLESMAADVPTVLVLQEAYWELAPEAQPYFQKLLDANILFYDAKRAAEHINNIYEAPERWWREAEVWQAKEAFRARFALTSANWRKTWTAELNALRQST